MKRNLLLSFSTLLFLSLAGGAQAADGTDPAPRPDAALSASTGIHAPEGIVKTGELSTETEIRAADTRDCGAPDGMSRKGYVGAEHLLSPC